MRTLDDNRARTDEAVVLDDYGSCLHWLENAADADTALSVLKEQGIDAYILGSIIKGDGEKVILE